MEAEMKKCKNKECQAVFSANWKHQYCPDCRKVRAGRRWQTAMDLLYAPGIVAMKIASRGNRHYQEKSDD